jgi:hypothetical protein
MVKKLSLIEKEANRAIKPYRHKLKMFCNIIICKEVLPTDNLKNRNRKLKMNLLDFIKVKKNSKKN